MLGQSWLVPIRAENIFFDYCGRNDHHIHITHSSQCVLQRSLIAATPVIRDLVKAIYVSPTNIIDGAMSVSKSFAQPCKTGTDENQTIDIVTLFRYDRLRLQPVRRSFLNHLFIGAMPFETAIGLEPGAFDDFIHGNALFARTILRCTCVGKMCK